MNINENSGQINIAKNNSIISTEQNLIFEKNDETETAIAIKLDKGLSRLVLEKLETYFVIKGKYNQAYEICFILKNDYKNHDLDKLTETIKKYKSVLPILLNQINE